LWQRPLEIKKILDAEHPDENLDVQLTVADVFVQHGRAATDGHDQRAVALVVQKPTGQPIFDREASVVQDWAGAAVKSYASYKQRMQSFRQPGSKIATINESEPPLENGDDGTDKPDIQMEVTPPLVDVDPHDTPVKSVEHEEPKKPNGRLGSPHSWSESESIDDRDADDHPSLRGREASEELGDSPVHTQEWTTQEDPFLDYGRDKLITSAQSGPHKEVFDDKIEPVSEIQAADSQEKTPALHAQPTTEPPQNNDHISKDDGEQSADTHSDSESDADSDIDMVDSMPEPAPEQRKTGRRGVPVVLIEKRIHQAGKDVAAKRKRTSLGELPPAKELRLEATLIPSTPPTTENKVTVSQALDGVPARRRLPSFSSPQRPFDLADRPPNIPKGSMGLGITSSPKTRRSWTPNGTEIEAIPMLPLSSGFFNPPSRQFIHATPSKAVEPPLIDSTSQLRSALRKTPPTDPSRFRRSVSFVDGVNREHSPSPSKSKSPAATTTLAAVKTPAAATTPAEVGSTVATKSTVAVKVPVAAKTPAVVKVPAAITTPAAAKAQMPSKTPAAKSMKSPAVSSPAPASSAASSCKWPDNVTLSKIDAIRRQIQKEKEEKELAAQEGSPITDLKKAEKGKKKKKKRISAPLDSSDDEFVPNKSATPAQKTPIPQSQQSQTTNLNDGAEGSAKRKQQKQEQKQKRASISMDPSNEEPTPRLNKSATPVQITPVLQSQPQSDQKSQTANLNKGRENSAEREEEKQNGISVSMDLSDEEPAPQLNKSATPVQKTPVPQSQQKSRTPSLIKGAQDSTEREKQKRVSLSLNENDEQPASQLEKSATPPVQKSPAQSQPQLKEISQTTDLENGAQGSTKSQTPISVFNASAEQPALPLNKTATPPTKKSPAPSQRQRQPQSQPQSLSQSQSSEYSLPPIEKVRTGLENRTNNKPGSAAKKNATTRTISTMDTSEDTSAEPEKAPTESPKSVASQNSMATRQLHSELEIAGQSPSKVEPLPPSTPISTSKSVTTKPAKEPESSESSSSSDSDSESGSDIPFAPVKKPGASQSNGAGPRRENKPDSSFLFSSQSWNPVNANKRHTIQSVREELRKEMEAQAEKAKATKTINGTKNLKKPAATRKVDKELFDMTSSDDDEDESSSSESDSSDDD
jgi:hypothetical protein